MNRAGVRGRHRGQRQARSVRGGAGARMDGQGLGALALRDWFLRAWLGPGLAGSPALMLGKRRME